MRHLHHNSSEQLHAAHNLAPPLDPHPPSPAGEGRVDGDTKFPHKHGQCTSPCTCPVPLMLYSGLFLTFQYTIQRQRWLCQQCMYTIIVLYLASQPMVYHRMSIRDRVQSFIQREGGLCPSLFAHRAEHPRRNDDTPQTTLILHSLLSLHESPITGSRRLLASDKAVSYLLPSAQTRPLPRCSLTRVCQPLFQ